MEAVAAHGRPWGEIDTFGQRIDRGGVKGTGDLDKAQLGPERLLPHEFGIDGDIFRRFQALAERFQVGCGRDQVHPTLIQHRRAAEKRGCLILTITLHSCASAPQNTDLVTPRPNRRRTLPCPGGHNCYIKVRP